MQNNPDRSLLVLLRESGAVTLDGNEAPELVGRRVRYSRACRLAQSGRMSAELAAECIRELRFGCELGDLSAWVWEDPTLRSLVQYWPAAVARVSSPQDRLIEWARYEFEKSRENSWVPTVHLAGAAFDSDASGVDVTVEAATGKPESDRSDWNWPDAALRWRGRGDPVALEGGRVRSHVYSRIFDVQEVDFDTLARFRVGTADWTYVGAEAYAPRGVPRAGFVEPTKVRKRPKARRNSATTT